MQSIIIMCMLNKTQLVVIQFKNGLTCISEYAKRVFSNSQQNRYAESEPGIGRVDGPL